MRQREGRSATVDDGQLMPACDTARAMPFSTICCAQDAGFVGTFGAWTIVGGRVSAPAAAPAAQPASTPAAKPLAALTAVPMASGDNSSGASMDAFAAATAPVMAPARPTSSGASMDAFPSALAAAAAARAHAGGSGASVDTFPVAMAAAAAPARANSSGASLDAFPEQAMGARLDGNGSFAWQALDAVRPV